MSDDFPRVLRTHAASMDSEGWYTVANALSRAAVEIEGCRRMTPPMTHSEPAREAVARALCRHRILSNLRFDPEKANDAAFVQRCEDVSWNTGEWLELADAALSASPAVESAQVKEAGPSLGSRLNHAALTIRGLSERIALMRESYTSNSALDHGRRQILDDFEKFLRSRASLAADAEG